MPLETPSIYDSFGPRYHSKIGYEDAVQRSVARITHIDKVKGVGLLVSGICMWTSDGFRVTFVPAVPEGIRASISSEIDPLHDPSSR